MKKMITSIAVAIAASACLTANVVYAEEAFDIEAHLASEALVWDDSLKTEEELSKFSSGAHVEDMGIVDFNADGVEDWYFIRKSDLRNDGLITVYLYDGLTRTRFDHFECPEAKLLNNGTGSVVEVLLNEANQPYLRVAFDTPTVYAISSHGLKHMNTPEIVEDFELYDAGWTDLNVGNDAHAAAEAIKNLAASDDINFSFSLGETSTPVPATTVEEEVDEEIDVNMKSSFSAEETVTADISVSKSTEVFITINNERKSLGIVDKAITVELDVPAGEHTVKFSSENAEVTKFFSVAAPVEPDTTVRPTASADDAEPDEVTTNVAVPAVEIVEDDKNIVVDDNIRVTVKDRVATGVEAETSKPWPVAIALIAGLVAVAFACIVHVSCSMNVIDANNKNDKNKKK